MRVWFSRRLVSSPAECAERGQKIFTWTEPRLLVSRGAPRTDLRRPWLSAVSLGTVFTVLCITKTRRRWRRSCSGPPIRVQHLQQAGWKRSSLTPITAGHSDLDSWFKWEKTFESTQKQQLRHYSGILPVSQQFPTIEGKNNSIYSPYKRLQNVHSPHLNP